jgi:hypothetical protein
MGEPGRLTAIEVVPATADRWADVVTLMGGNGDKGCWCQAPRGRAVGYGSSQPGARREALRSQLEEDPPPGMLAYLDGDIAGWCGFGPRPNLPRLERSRTIPKIDDLAVWSILCFNVRVGYRRRASQPRCSTALSISRGGPALPAWRRIRSTRKAAGST